jgi:hypothetical protein
MKVSELVQKYGLAVTATIPAEVILADGNVYFVNSKATNTLDANDGEHGNSWDQPFATLDYAVGRCTANQGDVILVAPGHTETVNAAAGLDLDVAGITIVGLGAGTNRPTVTIGLAATAGCDVDVNAANITVKNLLFNITAADITAMIDVNAANFTLEDCFIEMHADETTDREAVTGIDVNGGSANACDNLIIRNCQFHAYKGTAAGSAQAIELGEVADNVLIENCTIFGDFGNACIHNPTGKVLTRLTIKDCALMNLQTGDHCIELVSACTGMLIRNFYHGDTDAALADPGSCFSYECYGADTVDTNGFLVPLAGTAT